MPPRPPAEPSGSFARTVAALAESVGRELGRSPCPSAARDGARFALAQHARMPAHLRIPVRLATLAFDWSGAMREGRPFHADDPGGRAARVARWRGARTPACRDLMRFWESLLVYAWFAAPDPADGP